MLSILYGVSSALSWGTADFAGAIATRKTSACRAAFYSNVLGLILLLVCLAIFPESFPNTEAFVFAGIAGTFISVSMLILFHCMANGNICIAAPLSALSAAGLPVFTGIFIQGLPDPIQLLGVVLALFAIWLISRGNFIGLFKIPSVINLFLPVLAGFGFGFYFIFMHYAVTDNQSILWPMIAAYTTGSLLLFLSVVFRREPLLIPRNTLGVVLINVGCNMGGNFFYILALKFGRLDVSVALSSLYPAGTVILAWFFLKERILPSQWLGIFLALIAIIFFTA